MLTLVFLFRVLEANMDDSIKFLGIFLTPSAALARLRSSQGATVGAARSVHVEHAGGTAGGAYCF